MCGIAGIRRYGDEQITEPQIRMFLTGLEHRGNDATGIAMQKRDGTVLVLKNDKTPWQFVKCQEYYDFINQHLNDDIIQVVLHTRAATGNASPRLNANNHPLYAGKSAAIHNGVIHNDDEIFKELQLARSAQTDSDVLRAITDKFGLTKDAIQKMNKLRGSCATAVLHPEYPGWMLLARSGSPLTIGSTPDFYAFASEKNIIHRAMRPLVYRFKQWFQVQSTDMAFSPFPDNTAYLLGPDGLEWHDEFKTMVGTYHEPVRRVYQDYKDRQAKWDRESKKTNVVHVPTVAQITEKQYKEGDIEDGHLIVKCPKCAKRLSFTPEQAKQPRNKFCCPDTKCGHNLGEPISVTVKGTVTA